MKYAIVEKKNHLAIHQLFDSQEVADRFLAEVVPVYVAKSYYMDKTLKASDFEVIEYKRK